MCKENYKPFHSQPSMWTFENHDFWAHCKFKQLDKQCACIKYQISMKWKHNQALHSRFLYHTHTHVCNFFSYKTKGGTRFTLLFLLLFKAVSRDSNMLSRAEPTNMLTSVIQPASMQA